MKPQRSSFDPTYIRWRADLARFESRCFQDLCEFVRVRFDGLLERFFREDHESKDDDFAAWAIERYLEETERVQAGEDAR